MKNKVIEKTSVFSKYSFYIFFYASFKDAYLIVVLYYFVLEYIILIYNV